MELTLLKWSTGFQMVSCCSSTTDHKEWHREVDHLQVMEEEPGTTSWGLRGGVKAECWQREAGPGHMPFLGSVGSVLGFPGWGQISQFKPNEEGFGKLHTGVWFKWHIRAGRKGNWSQGLLEKSYQEVTFACDSVGCYTGHALAWEGYCQFKVTAGCLAK